MTLEFLGGFFWGLFQTAVGNIFGAALGPQIINAFREVFFLGAA